MAEAFSTGDELTVLARIELYVALHTGDGRARVTLEPEADGRPSGHAIAKWAFTVQRSRTKRGQLVVLEPDEPAALSPSSTYWVCLTALGEGADIAWLSGAFKLMPRRAVFAETQVEGTWKRAESISGPGHALRVVGRVGPGG